MPDYITGVEREAFVSYAGVTDADGAADGTTLKCSAIGSGSSYPDFNGNQIILTSGPYKGQARDINGATNADAAGTITVANAFGGQIVSGTSFVITGIRTVPAEVAALQASVGNAGVNMLAVTPADDASIAEYIRYAREMVRGHCQTRIGLIVPDLSNIDSDAANKALFALLEEVSTPNYIDQTKVDGGEHNWLEYDLLVVGSDANYAFTTSNLDDLVTMKIPIIVISSAVAAHLKMGDAAADTDPVTDIFVETRGDRVIGLLIDEGFFTGVGDQTIFSTPSVSSRLDMSNPQLSENLLATVGGGGGGTSAETVVGDLPYADGSGAILSLNDGTELPAGRTFAGCFLHAENLNSAGKELFRRLCHNITQSIVTPSLEIKANASKINRIWSETNAASLAQGAGSVASNAQLNSLVRAIADIVRAGGTGDLAAIKSETDKMISDSGSGTLNDANPSDTIVPASLPTKAHIVFDISNLNNADDDFTIEVKVGVSGSERVVAYYKLTSNGTDITCDTGSGIGSIIKVRRIDISDILCFTGEQIIVSRTKNSATDRDVEYKYMCGV